MSKYSGYNDEDLAQAILYICAVIEEKGTPGDKAWNQMRTIADALNQSGWELSPTFPDNDDQYDLAQMLGRERSPKAIGAAALLLFTAPPRANPR